MGATENYLQTGGYTIDRGRNFSGERNCFGEPVIIGNDVVKKVFENTDPIDREIAVGALKYRVIGTLKEKGSSMGMGADKVCWIPLLNAKVVMTALTPVVAINVSVNNVAMMEAAVNEATGLFRTIRKVPIGEENTFEIIQSDSLAKISISSLGSVTFAAWIIAFITLLEHPSG